MLAKSAPQFNIFIVGFPIKIISGFIVLLLTIPGLVYLFNRMFELMFTAMNELLRTIGA
jgi:flagellar biosynthetic protein FliR